MGLIGAIAAGSAYTTVRYLGLRGERGPFIVFFFSAFSCIVVLPYILLNYEPMTLKQLGTLLLAGVAASGGQFGVTYAYKFAPPGISLSMIIPRLFLRQSSASLSLANCRTA